jgi:hypothetical protein
LLIAPFPPLPPPAGAIAPVWLVAFVPFNNVPAEEPPPPPFPETAFAPLPPLYLVVPMQLNAEPPAPPVSKLTGALAPPTASTKFEAPREKIELPPGEVPGVAPLPTVMV